MTPNSILDVLKKRRWKISLRLTPESLLPGALSSRYHSLPDELVRFLSTIESATSESEHAWFLTSADYAGAGDAAFAWNEFERLSLESAESDAEREVTTRFWTAHFPFMFAVRSGYDYLAVDLSEDHFGRIVHGSEPDFESCREVATSFAEFLRKLERAAAAPSPTYPYDRFL